MPGPPAAVAAVRVAVRRALAGRDLSGATVLLGCSGGPDSLALAAGASFVVPRLGGRAGAVVVDHGLQPASAQVAARAAEQCRGLGLDPVDVVPVGMPDGRHGPEDAARRARYAALSQAAAGHGAVVVLLGHTRDDQAEQVLLGLARGSGARSLAGMPPERPLLADPPVQLVRPLLGLGREVTLRACQDLGLAPWQDPHNSDPRYARVRARQAVALLEESLGPGVLAGLARTADLLRDDAQALEESAGTAYRHLGHPPWPVDLLSPLPAAVRRRLWLRLAVEHGCPPGAVVAGHLRSIDSLVTDWHGQGPVDLPGGVRAGRRADRVWLRAAGPS